MTVKIVFYNGEVQEFFNITDLVCDKHYIMDRNCYMEMIKLKIGMDCIVNSFAKEFIKEIKIILR